MFYNPETTIINAIEDRVIEAMDEAGVRQIFFSEEIMKNGYFTRGGLDHVDCIVKSGASKCVIIPFGEDYVLKVPYHGYCDRFDGLNESLREDFDPENDIHYFTGAYECVDEDPDANNDGFWDYCYSELKIYQEAERRGFEMFFPRTERCDDIADGHIRLYVQERCETLDDVRDDDEFISRNSSAIGDKYFSDRFKRAKETGEEEDMNAVYELGDHPDWVGEAVARYGAEEVDNFFEFLDEMGVNDLHAANIGVSSIDGRPVIIDFSGYNM